MNEIRELIIYHARNNNINPEIIINWAKIETNFDIMFLKLSGKINNENIENIGEILKLCRIGLFGIYGEYALKALFPGSLQMLFLPEYSVKYGCRWYREERNKGNDPISVITGKINEEIIGTE